MMAVIRVYDDIVCYFCCFVVRTVSPLYISNCIIYRRPLIRQFHTDLWEMLRFG